GNAALCAALAAREGVSSVLVLEKAPRERRGGNTYFTGAAFRFPYDSLDDIRRLIPDLSEAEAEAVDVGAYPASQMRDDLLRSRGCTRVRRVRGERRDAQEASRAGLGARQGARHRV